MCRTRCCVLSILAAALLLTPFVITAEPASEGGRNFIVESSPNGAGVGAAGPLEVELSPNSQENASGDGAQARGYLGVDVQPLSRSLRDYFRVPSELGVLVSEVERGTPAHDSGLEAGDVITGLDGEAVATPGELTRAIASRPGQTVPIEVYREGRLLDLSAELGARASRRSFAVEAPEWSDDDMAEIGERIAEAFDKVDWQDLDERFAKDGEHWAEWGEEFSQRLSSTFENQDPEEWAELWEDFGERFSDWGEDFGERWAEWGEQQGEHWAMWGEQQGEHWEEWGERFAQRFEDMEWEEFGDSWAEWGEGQAERWAEWGERFAEDWASSGEHWGELGERIGDSVGSMDWDGLEEMIERVVSEVMQAVGEIEIQPNHP